MYVCVYESVVENLCTGSDRYIVFLIADHGQKIVVIIVYCFCCFEFYPFVLFF